MTCSAISTRNGGRKALVALMVATLVMVGCETAGPKTGIGAATGAAAGGLIGAAAGGGTGILAIGSQILMGILKNPMYIFGLLYIIKWLSRKSSISQKT